MFGRLRRISFPVSENAGLSHYTTTVAVCGRQEVGQSRLVRRNVRPVLFARGCEVDDVGAGQDSADRLKQFILG